MPKFTCLVLCVVAASLSHVYAVTEEEKAAFRESIKPALEECSKKYEVSPDDVKSAKEAGSADGINPCFISCMLKKTGVMTADGKLDHAAGLEALKKYVKDSDEVAKFEAIGKKCESVNDQEVDDGTEGCQRAKMLVTCLLKHKGELPLNL